MSDVLFEYRNKWIAATHELKPIFVEKIADALATPIEVIEKKIPMVTEGDDGNIYDELTYTETVGLEWYLFGGMVYEYIYDVDTFSQKCPFTPTSDVDIPIKIADKISTEYITVNHKQLLKSEFFTDIIFQVIKRLNDIDFSGLDIDALPPTTELDYVDNGKVRILLSENDVVGELVFQKIQLMINKDGIYDEIADIMISFEVNNYKDKRAIKQICGHDGVLRTIYYYSLIDIITSEFEALLERFTLNNYKTENHIGRIMWILSEINRERNDLNTRMILNTCSYFISRLERKYKVKTEDLKYLVLCQYRKRDITICDILEQISKYAISFLNPRFVILFN